MAISSEQLAGRLAKESQTEWKSGNESQAHMLELVSLRIRMADKGVFIDVGDKIPVISYPSKVSSDNRLLG